MKKLEILSDLKIFVQQQKIIYATEKYFSSKKQASQLESAELLTPCKTKIFGYLEIPKSNVKVRRFKEENMKQVD